MPNIRRRSLSLSSLSLALFVGFAEPACTETTADEAASENRLASTEGVPTYTLVDHDFAVVEQLPPTRIAGVEAHVTLERAVDLDPESLESTRLRVTFGQLTRGQYDALTARFDVTRAVAYDPARAYRLEDFLGPLVRFLEGRSFSSTTLRHSGLTKWLSEQTDETDSTSDETTFTTNCWQTALEVVRGDSTFNVYYPPAAAIAATFRNEELFAPVTVDERRPFDVLFLYREDARADEIVGQHAAIWLADGLYFEKTGSDDRYLFRFVTEAGIERDYPAANRMFLHPTGKPLPRPESFSVSRTDPDLAASLPLDIRDRYSVEIAFAQGSLAYSFFGIGSIPVAERGE